MSELFKAFRDLKDSPSGLWLVTFAFAVDAMAYFGVLVLMTTFMHEDIGLSDGFSSVTVSIFTGLVTLFMLGIGGAAEKLGIRRGILLALVFTAVGRAIYVAAPLSGGGKVAVMLLSLLVVAMGEGIVQPVAYAGVKQYTNENTSSMGYALLYAMMNLGIVLVGLVSPLVRVPVERMAKAGASPISGINAVNLTCFGITLFCFIVFASFMTRKTEANMTRPLAAQTERDTRPMGARLKEYFLGTKEEPSPFRDTRFVFFIFMLLPVRTLFAHQWLTLPAYVLRAYPPAVSDRMEWIVNWVNPGIIFFGVPLLTALTRKRNVYTMMIIGTTVSAVPTFLLCLGPTLPTLITYLVVFSIGEALWSSRFYEYASELAPEGRVAQYMGLANVPWIMAKMTTGLYSGAMLARYVPEHGPQNTEMLWLIYGFIAISTPIGLLLARSWVMKGLKTKPAPAPAAAA